MATPTATIEPIVVFWTRRDSTCDRCHEQLGRGSLIRVQDGSAACLVCADLDHLLFLPRGDAALTRRAARHSGLTAVVVQWSRSRCRYERQGILVEEPALERAEDECLADAARREARRQRSEVQRAAWDERFIEDFAAAIVSGFPGCPANEALAIASRACERRSGRVGRTSAGRSLSPDAVELAVRAHVRHRHTDYDEHLMAGRSRDDARASVARAVDAVLARWSGAQGVVDSQPASANTPRGGLRRPGRASAG